MTIRTISRSAVLLFSILLGAQLPSRAVDLEAGFANPSGDAKPLVWWHWINGNVTKEGIRADLEDMKRVGIGGAQILDCAIYLPKGPVRYGTDSWHEHIQYALKTAAELGLEISVANSAGWSGSGGPWIKPEQGMKVVVWSETETRGGKISLDVPKPKTKLANYWDLAVLAVPKTSERLQKLPQKIFSQPLPTVRPPLSDTPGIPLSQVLNLSEKMDEQGRLSATLPEGEWVVLRFGYTPTGSTVHPAQPEGYGFEANKLDVDTVTYQFEQSLGRIIREAGPLAGTTLKGVLYDSFEAGMQNWTEKFPADFTALKGYDFIPWLPLLTGRILGSQNQAEAVLWDFRDALDHLFTENYFGTIRRLAAARGLQVYSESQGGPLNPVTNNRHVDVPMNEFWMQGVEGRAKSIKLTVSAAAFYGRPIVGAESFTAKPEDGKFQAIPSTLKKPGDYAFSLGVNRFIFHHYTHQPVTAAAPGFSLGRYGTHFGRLNTWWPYADAWISYLSRSQFLLQQGRIVADIGILVDEDMGYRMPGREDQLPPGYDFLAFIPSQLAEMSVRDGRVVHPQGPSFALLQFPEVWPARVETLRELKRLVFSGAIILGRPPIAPAGLADLKDKPEFDALIAELWGDLDGKARKSRKFGAGSVNRGFSPEAVLERHMLPPDVSWGDASADFKFIHRTAPEGEVYFVFNNSEKSTLGEIKFRQSGRRPEIWDATTGIRADAPIYSATKDSVTVSIQFEPWGSVFVIFRKALPERWVSAAPGANLELKNGTMLFGGAAQTVAYSDGTTRTFTAPILSAPTAIAGPWAVDFTEGRGAPASATFAQLSSWSDSADVGIKHYSGTALYRTRFQSESAKEGRRAILDLGQVADIARVFINGQSVGVLWRPPFRVDVTRLLRDGENTLEVSIANRWINRLIGDEAIPVDYAYQPEGVSKFTDGHLLSLPDWLYDPAKLSTRKRHSFFVWKHYDANSPLVPSGLLGPVRIEWQATITL